MRGGAKVRRAAAGLRVRFIAPAATTARERQSYPWVEVLRPGAPARPLSLTPTARALFGTLALLVEGERAVQLEGSRRLGSKRAYSTARTKLLESLEAEDASDLIVLPSAAANNRGPLRLRHEHCEVDLLELMAAVDASDTDRIDELTDRGEGALDLAPWRQVIEDAGLGIDEDVWAELVLAARRRGGTAPAPAVPYLARLQEHCRTLPSWFPEEMSFAEIIQDVAVRPPSSQDEGDTAGGEGKEELASAPTKRHAADADDSRQASRRLPWMSALRQLRRVLLIGDPGAGKTWALRNSAIALAEAWSASPEDEPLPILVLAPKLEEHLDARAVGTGRAELIEAVAASMPDEIVGADGAQQLVIGALERGEPVALLIDGYDEIRSERSRLVRRLGDLVALLDGGDSYFVMASRPSSAPQRRFSKLATACDLQPFAEREQLRFVDTWFADDEDRAHRARRWVSDRRLDLLRTPLLLALFCAVFGSAGKEAPPESESELWRRALRRLASEEDRFGEVSDESELVRLRLDLLEALAGVFVAAEGLRDSVAIVQAEDEIGGLPAWAQLASLTRCGTVVDDLVSTGIARKVTVDGQQEIAFLHSALRDYLLARLLARDESWGQFIPRLWAQPEWEPVIGFLGTLVKDPNELVGALEVHFDDDPLNAARLAAGRILASAGPALGEKHGARVRDELLILLASPDAIDRGRSATALAMMQDRETASLVRTLVNPAVPSHVVISALRTIAGGTSRESITTLTDCVRSINFTEGEHTAAIEALADMGSEGALAALGELAADSTVGPTVRAAAAFSALRLYAEDEPARQLLESADEDSRLSRWTLAEILAGQAEVVGDLIEEVRRGRIEVSDSYCLALFEALRGYGGPGLPELVLALPESDAVETLAAAVESARERSAEDPLIVPLARYVLAVDRRPDLRWGLARAILDLPDADAGELCRSVTEMLPLVDGMDMAEFLAAQITELPDDLGRQLEQSLDRGDFGPGGQFALRERSQMEQVGQGSESRPPESESSPAGADAEPLELEAILRSSNLGPAVQYQLLREHRRRIPPSGEVRKLAALLTHRISADFATAWIDAQPAVAPRVEVRLSQAAARYETRVELACLRSHWPGRYHEVVDTAGVFHYRLLDARAEAALLAGDLVEAATMALASIGARHGEGRPPTSQSAALLFAAGAASGRTWSTLKQVTGYVSQLPESSSRILLICWIEAANMKFPAVEQAIEVLPAYVRATDANVAGLRMAAGLAEGDAFDAVTSWSHCKRVATLLAGVKNFTSAPEPMARIEKAIAAAELRAGSLAMRWPESGVDPGDQATPGWASMLVRIAAAQLHAGNPEVAATIFGAVVEEEPSNPTFVNNLGFCQVPIDREAAMKNLERAAGLYRNPFGVNVANRMLLNFLAGDFAAAHQLGDDYYEGGPVERGGSWLWDMDEPTALREDVNVLDYVIRLGRKAAVGMNDDALFQLWEQRQRLRSGGTEPDSGSDDSGREDE